MKYDYLIVGAGLFGAVCANILHDSGRTVLVLDRREHIGGNCYTREMEGIQVHLYGAHIFRTNSRDIWSYIERFCELNNFVNSPVANYKGQLYNLPFNMNTFYALWGARTPDEARRNIERTRIRFESPSNLEEHVLDLVGSDIYKILVKGYTEKQWGHPCSDLPASIMRRIPLRFTFDNNYFSERYQGIPIGGYTSMIEKMLDGCRVELGVDYNKERQRFEGTAASVIYTGPIDEYFGYCLGPLEYRSLRFEHKVLDEENHQGVAVMNYTSSEVPYTRSIEHKHFEFGCQSKTVVSYEYPSSWNIGEEPYYPMEDVQNRARYDAYRSLAEGEKGVYFGGRLGEYKYYDMQDTIKSAWDSLFRWFGIQYAC